METAPHDRPESNPSRPTVWWPLQEGEVYFVAGKPAEHWVLEMIGAFASLQQGIETILGVYLRRFSREVAKKITQKHFGRLSDEDRWDYVKALASDAGYKGELMHSASDAYWRCKRVRDLASHQTGLTLVRDQSSLTYHYLLPLGTQSKGIPEPLTPEQFRLLAAEARWLDALVDHIGYLAGIRYILPIARIGSDGEPQERRIEILEPPPLPISPEWDKEGLNREINSPPSAG